MDFRLFEAQAAFRATASGASGPRLAAAPVREGRVQDRTAAARLFVHDTVDRGGDDRGAPVEGARG